MQTNELLKNRCYELLLKAQKNNDAKNIELYNTIAEILTEEDSLNKMDAEITLNILKDLGFSKYESLKILSNLVQGR